MNAEIVKQALMRYYLFERQFLLVTTEQVTTYGTADVWVMDKDYLALEIEVKVSRSDLLGELNSIRDIKFFNNPTTPSKQLKKYRKHYRYLTKYHQYDNKSILPNRFYYCVPASLMDIALEYLKHTPYGILVCVENEVQHEGELLGVYHNIKVVKSGKCLHNGKVSENIVKQTIRRICSENYNLRSKKNGKNNEDGKGN